MSSTIGTAVRAIGRALDFLRKFLHLILLLIIFGFIFGAWRVSLPTVPSSAALLVAPEGELVEQLTGDPLTRALAEAQGQGRAETLLWDVTDAIRAAAKDDRIKLMVLDLEYFEGAGQPTLQELANAIAEFRKAKKKVIAYATSYSQERYYAAAQADEIYLDPLGEVVIDGYESYVTFLTGLAEKLAIEVNVFRVGTFKSAVEFLTRKDMSPEAREQALVYLNSLWSSYQKAMTSARKLQADSLNVYANTLAERIAEARGDAAQVALKAGLVTGLKTRQEVEAEIIKAVGEDEQTGSFRSVTHDQYVRIVHAQKKLIPDGTPRVGVIVASGDILDGEQPPGTIGGDSLSRLIREARMDDDVRAVVLRVDSPGGSVMASEQIHRELMALKAAGKPVIASMGDLAASGGYYIATPADEIWASPATLTGSIGIFAIIPTFGGLLGKVDVTTDGVGTTDLSGQLRLDRPLGEDAKKIIQSMVERGYEVFLEHVAKSRNKTRDEIDAVAQGRVWAGVDAARLGLVDKLGSFDDAVKAAAKRANLTDYEVKFIQPQLSFAQELVLQLRTRVATALLKVDSGTQSLVRLAKHLDPLQRELERLERFSTPHRLYSYCFCTAP
jgi:protease-4